MASSGSKLSIYGAITANLAIAISKFIAGAYTGSSAMISEGVHSLVDTSNGGLLLYGIKKASKPADSQHPFGYGKEIYFWSFVVAILIFALGGGIALYEGIHHVIQPKVVTNYRTNYLVLGLAILFEGISLFVALREFNKTNSQMSLLKSIKRSKDSSSFVIIIEDFGAMIGLVVALLGLLAGHYLDWPTADGFASVIIGLILLGMATFLAIETKGLLIGEAMNPEEVAQIKSIILASPIVMQIVLIQTVHFGPNSVLIGVKTKLKQGLVTNQISNELADIEEKIIQTYPFVKYVFIEPENIN